MKMLNRNIAVFDNAINLVMKIIISSIISPKNDSVN